MASGQRFGDAFDGVGRWLGSSDDDQAGDILPVVASGDVVVMGDINCRR